MSEPVVAKARALTALLAEHAAEAERRRRPANVVIEALRDAGVFDLLVPACHGGLGLDLDAFVDVGLALGEGDASMAWVATFYIEHNWLLCQFPETFQKELYASKSHVLAPAAIAPASTAEPILGGYRLSGRWQWGTGIMHAEWVIVGAMVPTGGGPEMRLFALPREDVSVDDVWFTDGMCGTGSNDIVLDDAFVPDERSVATAPLAAGRPSPHHDHPVYAVPMLPVLSLAAAMPAVGQARAAVETFREHMTHRVLYGTGAKQIDKPAAQMRLGRADVESRQAERVLRAVAGELMELRSSATVADRARLTASLALAVDQSKRVLQSLSEASGASAHFTDHPLQRAVRDVQTLSCHVVFDLDARTEILGRAMVGMEPAGLL